MIKSLVGQGQDFKKVFFHIIPVLLIIIIFEIVAIQIYANSSLYKSSVNFFIWIGMQAIGSIILGYISDKHCRKKILISIQIFALIFLSIIYFYGFKSVTIFLLGLTFNPSPIARAATIDNFSKYSKVKLIAITFIAQFIPWSFYSQIVSFKAINVIFYIIIFLIFNLIITTFLFYDKRDKESKKQKVLTVINSKKLLIILGAFLPAQIVFFLSDSFFESMVSNQSIFAALGMGSLIGASLSLFYRKVPHISFLTICYGIGIILSLVPLCTTLFLPLSDINLSYQLMIFSTIGGFYIPFIYDVILSSALSKYRGTACGLIDAVVSLAAIIGLSIILIFKPNVIIILALTTLLFLLATTIQKLGEKA